MLEADVTFHNKLELKIQAQIFSEYTLISTGIAESGETCTLPNDAEKYDVYFRDLVKDNEGRMPDEKTIYDYYYDAKENEYKEWSVLY